jgi:hypothetical protein
VSLVALFRAVAVLNGAELADADVTVGELGDPERINFEGASAFTPDQLRNGLIQNAGFLLASHSHAPLQPFLEMLSHKIQSGYQAQGFPEVQVSSCVDERGQSVRVQIIEGPRFRCGEIKIIGRKTLPLATLRVLLTTAPVKQLASVAEENNDSKAPDSTSASQTEPNVSVTTTMHLANINNDPRQNLSTSGDSTAHQPKWVAGEYASFGTEPRDEIEAVVKDGLAQYGFFFPKIRVNIELRPASSTADLIVEVVEEGPRGMVSEIEISGNHKNSRKDILKLLGLKPGMAITRPLIARAEDKLWHSARFSKYEISPEAPVGPEAKTNSLKLSIKLWEFDESPKLTDKLSTEEKALLKLCDWLQDLESRSEDAILFYANTSTNIWMKFAATAIFSPRQGLLMQFSDPADIGSPYSILVGKGNLAIYPPNHLYKLLAQRTSATARISLLPMPPPSEHPFNLEVGAGFEKQGVAETEKAPVPPVQLNLKLAPLAFLHMAHDTGTICRVQGKKLTVTGPHSVLTADAETGQLREFQLRSNENSASVRFVDGAFNKASRELEAASLSAPNRFAPDHPLSSMLSFSLTEMAKLKLWDPLTKDFTAAQRERAMQSLNKLLAAEILAPLDRAATSTKDSGFLIPLDAADQALAQNSSAATVYAAFAFRYCNDFFPKYSWPWTVVHESVFVFAQQATYTQAEITRLFESDNTGPIGSLVIASLLTKLDSGVAKTFAIRGLTRLSASDFRTDCQLFLAGESGLARCFGNIASALREMPEQDVAALAAALPKAEGALLSQCAASLRNAPSQPLSSSLAPALNNYWEDSLRGRVRSSLQKLVSQTVFERSGNSEP